MKLYSDRCAATGKVSHMDEMPFFRFIYLSEDEIQRVLKTPV